MHYKLLGHSGLRVSELYLGMPDVPAWVVAQANTLVERYGLSPFCVLSLQYNLVEHAPERDLLLMAEAFGLGVTVWAPLAGGLLSGKYTRKASQGGGSTQTALGRLQTMHATAFTLTEHNRAIVGALQQVADELGAMPPRVALNWLRARSNALIPIPSASKAAQIKDNLGCLAVT